MIKSLLSKIDNKLFRSSIFELPLLLSENLTWCNSLLDVGCGSDSPVKDLIIKIDRKVGVDIFQQSLETSNSRGIHDEYVQINVLNILEHFREKSFDAVIANDLIEHLTKQDGLELIRQMESVARKRVIIYTPNGFLKQGAIGGNEYQRHLSGWEPEEMRDYGYEVIGAGGWKRLRGEAFIPIIKPIIIGERFCYLTNKAVRNHPKHAYGILCIKNFIK